MSIEDATDRRLRAVETSIDELKRAVAQVAEAINKLVVIEERSLETRRTIDRAFETLKDHEQRLRDVEEQMPLLVETRRWVVLGVLAGLSMMGVGLAKLLIR